MSSVALLLILGACASAGSRSTGSGVPAPRVDYHQHFVSPSFEPIVSLPARNGPRLLAMLDSARVEKAIVLSVGYNLADERRNLSNPDSLTRWENDWTSEQVAASRGRLVGFCSANPHRGAALAELDRCLGLPAMRGVKLHFGNSGISLRDPAHADRIAAVFALAERRRAAVLVHMRARGGLNFGAEDARVFLDRLMPAAPSVDVIVAHFGGAGSYGAPYDSVMSVFGAAAERGDARMRNVYFDMAMVVTAETSDETAALIARRIRQVGTGRVLYGSDLSPPGGSIAGGWRIFTSRLPLNDAEFRAIAGNVLRFMR